MTINGLKRRMLRDDAWLIAMKVGADADEVGPPIFTNYLTRIKP